MRIGIDFDNTIVNYTGVFYQVALELKWLPATIGNSKSEVKRYFIDTQQEDKWTELQGLVYGKYISKAKPYEDVKHIMKMLREAGHELFIISHKTKFPFIGEQNNLHIAAKNWLVEQGFLTGEHQNDNLGILPYSQVFFNEKKEQKLAKVAELECDVFIDDLLEILNHELFPKQCQPVLFDPDEQQLDYNGNRVGHWRELMSCL